MANDPSDAAAGRPAGEQTDTTEPDQPAEEELALNEPDTVDTVISFRSPFAERSERTPVAAAASEGEARSIQTTPNPVPLTAPALPADEPETPRPRETVPLAGRAPPVEMTTEDSVAPPSAFMSESHAVMVPPNGDPAHAPAPAGLFTARERTVVGWALALALVGAFAAFGLGFGIGLAH